MLKTGWYKTAYLYFLSPSRSERKTMRIDHKTPAIKMPLLRRSRVSSDESNINFVIPAKGGDPELFNLPGFPRI
jgi:hypothetical protein